METGSLRSHRGYFLCAKFEREAHLKCQRTGRLIFLHNAQVSQRKSCKLLPIALHVASPPFSHSSDSGYRLVERKAFLSPERYGILY